MSKLIKKRTKKAGLPPGSLVYTGDKKLEKVKITIVDYNEEHFEEKEVKTIEECLPFKDESTVTWINIEGVHDIEIIQKIGNFFELHPLLLEDILNTDQRPKMEVYGDRIYIVFKALHYTDKNNNGLETEQISLILGPNFVISFQEEVEGDDFKPVRERIRNDKCILRKMKADYLAYTLIDAIVDNYFVILEKIGEKIEGIETELVTEPDQKTLKTVHSLKRDMIFIRKSVWPLREVMSALGQAGLTLVHESTRIYLRDVYDHIAQALDIIETYRDMTSGMIDIYLSGNSNKLNEVMKVLTIIATIFIPLTFIAGVYGMNFKFMPEIEWRLGYAWSLFLMFSVAIVMLVYFKRKKWL